MTKSEKILEFLRAHPLISHTTLAGMVGFDKGSLSKLVNNTGRLSAIPEKFIPDMEDILKEYGYK